MGEKSERERERERERRTLERGREIGVRKKRRERE